MSSRHDLKFNRMKHSSPQDYYEFLLCFLDTSELDLHVEVQRNTYIRKCKYQMVLPDETIAIRVCYYGTDVVTLLPDGTVIYYTGNWCTQSTHNRMTNFSPFNISGGRERSWILTPDGYESFGSYLTVEPHTGRKYCRHFRHTEQELRAKYISLEISRVKRRKLEMQRRKEMEQA